MGLRRSLRLLMHLSVLSCMMITVMSRLLIVKNLFSMMSPGPDPEEEPPPSPVQPVLRRSDRIPDYDGVYLNTTQANKPSTINEALSGSESDKWKKAMDQKMELLKANNVYDLVELAKDI